MLGKKRAGKTEGVAVKSRIRQVDDWEQVRGIGGL